MKYRVMQIVVATSDSADFVAAGFAKIKPLKKLHFRINLFQIWSCLL